MGYPQQKTHNLFIEELLLKNKYYKNGEFEIVGKYEKVKKPIKIKNKYGEGKMSPDKLLRGSNFTMHAADNKKEYCNNILKEHGVNLELVNVSSLKETIYNTEFGLCKAPFYKLKNYKKPNISSAIDKTDFMKKEFKKIHGLEFDYSESIFTNAKTKVVITCKKHKNFKLGYNQHKNGQKCPKCSDISRRVKIKNNGGWRIKDWWKQGISSKNFDSFKLYIIRCWNNKEEFYKIGRTFVTIKNRFKNRKAMPYKHEVVQIRESEDALKIYCLEKSFKKKNKNNRYTPKKKFHGYRECYDKIIDINNGKEIK